MEIKGLWGIPGLVWPRPYELIAKVDRGEDLNSRELLALKSESFYGPIRLLELAKGSDEESKEFYVRTCYNVLRELDECEDIEKLTKEEKISALTTASFVIGEVDRLKPNNDNGKGIRKLEEIIEKEDDFRSLTEKLKSGAIDKKELIFIEQFGKGTVLRDMYYIIQEGENGKRIIKALSDCTSKMADAMIKFLEKGPIQRSKQLGHYCYHVAGRIGSRFLNEIVQVKDNTTLNDGMAEQFGSYLQLINITKNVEKDYKEGRRFLPGGWIHYGVSFESMMDVQTISLNASRAREGVFNKILYYIDSRFDNSISYLISIPEKLSGYKAFCLVPLITGQKTVETMKDAGADSVFKGLEKAIKIDYGIGTIMNFSYNIVKHENGTKANVWLEEFRKEPRRFSFRPEDYVNWAKDWIGIDSDVLKSYFAHS